MKILIVDDVDYVQQMLRDYFQSRFADATIYLASNGLEALSIWDENQNIDVILFDYFMPVMNGIEMLNKLKEKFSDKIPKLILMTGSFDPYLFEDLKKDLSIPLFYLPKPFGLKNLDKLLSLA